MDTGKLLQEYSAGPQLLSESVEHVPPAMLDQHPVPDSWSIRQVVCHLADAEIVYADRIKRILIEDNPTLMEWCPDRSVRDGLCLCRDFENELNVVRSIRLQIVGILRALELESWQRTAVHSKDGPMTLETLVERITLHIPHHVNFIREKTTTMEIS